MREWLKVGFILTLVFGGYIFADVKMSEKYPNVPADIPEECIAKIDKEDSRRTVGYGSSLCYKFHQKFDNGFFHKDPNTWVVTPKFAKTFGMPDEFISQELQGVEAIAYRKETFTNGALKCGMGGMETNCILSNYGILDIYVDEKKTPLPWFHKEQMANMTQNIFSMYYLETDNLKDSGLTNNMVKNEATKDWRNALRPFADPITKHEAVYFQSGAGGWQEIISGIYGYKRDSIEGLTVISFFFNFWGEGENIGKTIALISDFEGVWRPKNGKIHHQFYIPGSFGNKIRIVDEARKKKDREFFQETLNKMGYEIKVKEPQTEGFFQKLFK